MQSTIDKFFSQERKLESIIPDLASFKTDSPFFGIKKTKIETVQNVNNESAKSEIINIAILKLNSADKSNKDNLSGVKDLNTNKNKSANNNNHGIDHEQNDVSVSCDNLDIGEIKDEDSDEENSDSNEEETKQEEEEETNDSSNEENKEKNKTLKKKNKQSSKANFLSEYVNNKGFPFHPWIKYDSKKKVLFYDFCIKAIEKKPQYMGNAEIGYKLLEKEKCERDANSAAHEKAIKFQVVTKEILNIEQFTSKKSTNKEISSTFDKGKFSAYKKLFFNIYWSCKEELSIMKISSLHTFAKNFLQVDIPNYI